MVDNKKFTNSYPMFSTKKTQFCSKLLTWFLLNTFYWTPIQNQL